MLQRKYLLPALVFISTIAGAQHPFKYDNTIYRAVYLVEAFRLMDTMKNFLLLDVRSPGEYADTSRATALNIGRIRGSVNVTSDSVPAHLAQLKKYIDQPVFVYCSHSQRSRRVSKLLAENGFRKVYNINGGMTELNDLDNSSFPDKKKILVTHLAYQNIASTDAYNLILNIPGLVIIDIRTPQEFASKDSLQANNIGHLKNAINIPQADFTKLIDSFNIPKNSPVLLYDQLGYNSMDVVDLLRSRGYSRIYNLFEGYAAFISDHRLKKKNAGILFADPPPYQMLDAEACIDLMKEPQNLIILDTRPTDEFENKAGNSYMNVGRIKEAIHVASLESLFVLIQQKDKSSRFLVYGSHNDLAASVCMELAGKGFRHVNYLQGGLYHFVWSTANIEDCRDGKKFLMNHEGLY